MNPDRTPAATPPKRFMYVNRRAPHGSIYALECLEAVLVTAAFDQEVSLVFVDDGVYQLKAGQDTGAIGTKNFSKAYRALDDHGVKEICVERESLETRGLNVEDLMIPVAVRSADELREIIARQHVVIGF
jgi:tRNA 2-thiouridine synthesizing protein C